MKKILGILLTAVMLFTSMGVLATETETVAPVTSIGDSFEDNEERLFSFYSYHGISIVEAENGVEPVSGTKMLKFIDMNAERTASLIPANVVLEENSKYKLSFYHYADLTAEGSDGNSPYIYFSCGSAYIRNVFRTIIKQTSTVAEWKKCELYFVTGEDVTSMTFSFAHRITDAEKGTEYFDDFKIEKVDEASVGFYTGTIDSRATSELADNSYYKPEKNYKMGEQTLTVHPIAIHGVEVKSVQDAIVSGVKQDIKIATKYTPKALGERATLLVGIYKNDANGTPVLQKVKLDTWDYTTTTATSGILDTGINYVTVAANEYDADCYIKAFMVNNFSDLDSISNIVTLPAAAAATPAA